VTTAPTSKIPTDPVHRFNLLHYDDRPGDEPLAYTTLTRTPPAGCVPTMFDRHFGLVCERSAPTYLAAVAQVCGEIATQHGILMTDLGVEKLWEWLGNDKDGPSATILGQLLLMALQRGEWLGYSVDDLVEFLRTANGNEKSPHVHKV
jgi:hypothetical protein